jgi:PAS domain S-box-containing protein
MNKLFDIDSALPHEIYQGFFDDNSSIMIIVDPVSQTIVDANKAALEFYGESKRDFIGKKVNQINIDSDSVISKGMKDVLSKKRNHFIFKHRAAGGIIRDVEVNSVRITLEGKDLLYTIIVDITERLQSRAELSRLHTAIIQSPGPIGMTDLQGVFTFVNPAFCKLSGYTHDELVGSHTRMLRSGHQDDAFYAKLWNSILNGENWAGEFSNVGKEGKVYIEEARISQVCNDQGEITHFIKVSRDVTKEREMEQELEDSRNVLLQILNNMPGGYMMIDDNFRIRQVNKKVCEISGYTQAELIGGRCSMICAKVKPHKECPFLVHGDLSSCGQDTLLKCKNGDTIPILKNARFIELNGERLLIENFQNIGELKKTEKALISAKDLAESFKLEIETIIENTNESIWAIDREYHITYLNQPAKSVYLALFGIDLFIGLKFTDILDDAQKLVWMDVYERGFSGERFSFQYDVDIDLSKYHIEVLVSPVVKKNVVEGIYFYASDVTHRIEENKALSDAKAKAEESDRLKSAFLANMSHEIRTPMNGILGFTNLLETQSLTDEKRGTYIEYIKKSGARMLNTVNDIIEISKIEVGEVAVKKQHVNVTDTLKDIYEFFRFEAAEKGLLLSLEIPNNINSLTINTDLSKFESIVTNFVKNAIKYSDTGDIVIGFQLTNDQFNFYCKDDGIGIPQDRLKGIFNRFEQADIEDEHAFQGSGLGLAISKAYIEMLDGEIEVASLIGTGSTFSFTIPVAIVEQELNEEEATLSLVAVSNLRILVADDDLISQEFLSIILTPCASTILFADDGQQAVEVYKNNEIDVILMDLKMPIMSGYDATREIRKTDDNVFIIAQTAYALAGDKDEALAAGCDAYISKPVNKEELISILKSVVH